MGISTVWQTTHTICGSDRALVIDSPVTPCELAALRSRVAATDLIATHADWDHLLAPLAFPHATRFAHATTIQRLGRDHAAIAGELATWDASHRLRPRTMPDWCDAQTILAPTTITSPVGPIEISPTPGHTRDGIALLATDDGVLVVGDYLSPCEIPSVSADAGWDDYLASLDQLDRLIARARCVVPGHGWPLDRARARTILTEDRNYIIGLAHGTRPRAPRHRADVSQQAQHRANLVAVRGR